MLQMSGFLFADEMKIKKGDLPVSLKDLRLSFSSNVFFKDRCFRGMGGLAKLDLTMARGSLMYVKMLEEDLSGLEELAISR